nr:hypothetical protein [Methylocystis sp. Sn-Cys]
MISLDAGIGQAVSEIESSRMPSFAKSLEASDGGRPDPVVYRYDRQIRVVEKIIEQGVRL